MLSITKNNFSIHNLSRLPRFADFLLTQITDFTTVQLQFLQELDFFSVNNRGERSPEKTTNSLRKLNTRTLKCLSENKAVELTEISINGWIASGLFWLPVDLDKAEEITYLTLVFKKSFEFFIPSFTQNLNEALTLIREIDSFLTALETATLNNYFNSLHNRINKEAHFNKKISDYSPGIIYVFSMEDLSVVYINKRGEEHLGVSSSEIKKLTRENKSNFIYSEDLERTIAAQQNMRFAKDDEVRTIEYRLKNNKGEYVWMRSYMAVFKRDTEGQVTEVVNFVQTTEEEKKTREKLEESQRQLLEAQEIAQLGSFVWSFSGSPSQLSPECRKILEVEVDNYMAFWKKIHPNDKERLQNEIKKAKYETGCFESQYRYEGKEKEKLIWARGVINYQNNIAVSMTGTVMDVTERHLILEQLTETNKLYEQAQALSHLGHYIFDIEKREISFTDEVARIYGLKSHEKNEWEILRKMRHPDDEERVQKELKTAIANGKNMDIYFRIIRRDGMVKVLRSRGEPVLNKEGKTVKFIGTLQDETERQALLQQLEQSEALFKQAQALAHIGSWRFEIKENKMSWSDETYRIFGLEPQSEGINLEKFLNYIPDDDRTEVQQIIEVAIKEKTPFDIFHCIQLKNGSQKTVSTKGEVTCNTKGEVLSIDGSIQDVTEQKRFEKELQENQTFIQKIADAAPSTIISYNIHNGKILYINEGIQKLLGYDIEEIKNKGFAFFKAIIHPEDCIKVDEFGAKALDHANKNPYANSDTSVFTYRIKHKNGQYRWFETHSVIFDRNSNGHVEHLLTVSIDITERIQAEQTITEQQHFIQHIADASPTIIYLYDVENDSIGYVNREIFFVLGYTPEEILEMGNTVTDVLYHPDDFNLLPERKKSSKKIKENNLMLQFECRMKNKEGDWQWFLVREVVFKTNEESRVTQIVGAALDITKRKDMERTLLFNSFKLEQSNASLEEFAYVASHDLKEPLRKISTFGDRLVATQLNNLNPEGKIYLKKIVDASQRMQTMISDLLSISLISGDKSFENYSLQSVLEETLQTLEYKIEQKNAIVRSDGLPVANIIPSQFRQLFQNLLSNSLKFVRENIQPEITITHRFLNPEEVEELGGAGKYLRIEFTDNGIGFENEFAGKIFAIFQRLHGRSEYEGSGIGLAICKKIVEHHGGVIYASGVLDKGATFTIILPA